MILCYSNTTQNANFTIFPCIGVPLTLSQYELAPHSTVLAAQFTM